MSNRHPGVRSFPAPDDGPERYRGGAAPHCSFCEMGEGRVAYLFEGRRGYICNECVQVCAQLISDYAEMSIRPSFVKAPWYRRLLVGGEQVLAVCDFCGVAYGARERLLAGRSALICGRCVRTCEVIGAEDT